ncbi:MAG: CPBP family intramembrane metalloprotease, partial [Anaerolineaceae bacterium]|nr:CPBP family intramembrane metalloprotease [Anaerolineaceae bacterium]
MVQQKSSNLILNSERQLRNGWWIIIFFLVLASILVPTLLVAQQNTMDVSFGLQAVIVALTSFICQLLRRKPITELLGKLNEQWFKQLFLGGLVGSALMLIPALIMRLFGWVDWQWNLVGFSNLLTIVLLFAGVAAAEEMLFRGFIFQRLIAGVGVWSAQLVLAGLFLLTHLNNPGMTGNGKVLAGINIFLASILFGFAFIRTKSLAMPIGMHFMANFMQGGVLGFGVSGTHQTGILRPIFSEAPEWLTGGKFGIEASLPGLICVMATLV